MNFEPIELSRRGQVFMCNTSKVFFIVVRTRIVSLGVEHDVLRFDRASCIICEMEKRWMDDPNDDRYTRVV